MVAESWFRSLWGKPKKHDASPQKVVIGVLAFEFASLMSKVVHLWQSLSDKNVKRLREEIADSNGIKKLVSDDYDFIVRLICFEIIENLGHVARSVARLAQKCSDPNLKSFEIFFEDMMSIGYDPCRWKFTWKKMEKKVKKMERFISVNANLYQEMEILSELEQTSRRMKGGETDPGTLLEYQKKVVWKRHEVKSLQDMSLWNKSYDYAVKLLVRSLFTVFVRVKQVFGIQQMVDHIENGKDLKALNMDYIHRNQSVSAFLQASVHPSESVHARYSSSGPLGPPSKANVAKNFYSGPLGRPTKAVPVPVMNISNVGFHSAPLGKQTKSGLLFGSSKIIRGKKKSTPKHNQLTSMGPLKGCMMNLDADSEKNQANDNMIDGTMSCFSSKSRLLNALPETLGSAGLALHYANVIIVIEKLAASPHLIGLDARDDLYNMLPASVRDSLRTKLKPYAKGLASSRSIYDTDLAGEWSEAISGILEWLGPLAHNMIRWQSERSFEQQNLVSKTNVLLVQTLYFAKQEKTEAIITELLVGLNYIWRFGRELNAKALIECASSRIFDEYLYLQG